jgi:hypothetical protein
VEWTYLGEAAQARRPGREGVGLGDQTGGEDAHPGPSFLFEK